MKTFRITALALAAALTTLAGLARADEPQTRTIELVGLQGRITVTIPVAQTTAVAANQPSPQAQQQPNALRGDQASSSSTPAVTESKPAQASDYVSRGANSR